MRLPLMKEVKETNKKNKRNKKTWDWSAQSVPLRISSAVMSSVIGQMSKFSNFNGIVKDRIGKTVGVNVSTVTT